MSETRPAIAAVLLTQGNRPGELAAAIESIRRQREVTAEVIVVWNGAPPPLSDDPLVRQVAVAENVGIPEGRNIGARHATAPLMLFLDDDAELTGEGVLSAVLARFDVDHRLAVVAPRIVDEDGRTAQRYVPRIGGRSALRGGSVTTFLGGASIVRRQAFDEVGGYEGALFYSMEETDLAWRLVDRGWSIWYDPELIVQHPRTTPARHTDSVRRTARNRVWIAHRMLPALLAAAYLGTWFVIAVVRVPRQAGAVIDGYRTGWHTRIGPRRPIGWRTVARLTARPPADHLTRNMLCTLRRAVLDWCHQRKEVVQHMSECSYGTLEVVGH